MSAAEVVVACAADAGYAMPLAAMLCSAASALDPRRSLTAFVVDDGLGPENRARVGASLPDGVRIRWVAGDRDAVAGLSTWGRMPRTTFQRLLVPDLLPPEVRRAVWLDCDVIVLADLGRLWDEDLGAHHLLAAQDMGVPLVSSHLGVPGYAALGIPADAKYFNAGVMVMDLERWRREDVAGRVARYLAGRGSAALFWDQEGLNAVLHDGWGEVDVRWNVNASLARGGFYHPRHLGPDAQRAVAEDPWIVHFCGNLKPWRMHDTGDPARRRWFEQLDGTVWAGWRPAATPARRLAAAYETSRLRRVVHPMESRVFEALAMLSRARRG